MVYELKEVSTNSHTHLLEEITSGIMVADVIWLLCFQITGACRYLWSLSNGLARAWSSSAWWPHCRKLQLWRGMFCCTQNSVNLRDLCNWGSCTYSQYLGGFGHLEWSDLSTSYLCGLVFQSGSGSHAIQNTRIISHFHTEFQVRIFANPFWSYRAICFWYLTWSCPTFYVGFGAFWVIHYGLVKRHSCGNVGHNIKSAIHI